MTKNNYSQAEGRSVLAHLRGMAPERRLRFSEALRVAEWQATRLLELMNVDDAGVPGEIISELPRIRVRYVDLPTSGMSYWEEGMWIICLNRHEPATRQRFTLFHEFKHIIDHGTAQLLYRGQGASSEVQAEQAADFFAGCVLIPKRLLKREWGHSLQDVNVLARHFDVSPRAITVRLAQIGLSDPLPCCQVEPVRPKPRFNPGMYHRQLSLNWPLITPRKEPSHA